MSGPELFNPNTQGEYMLFVGDLDENCNDKILLSNFTKYGTRKAIVQKARNKPFSTAIPDKYYGILYFEKKEDLNQAQKEMDNQVILNNRIRVCIYKNYSERVNSDIFIKGVGNLTDQQLTTHFSQFGEVLSVKIPKDKSGQSLNYSYLSFGDKQSRDKCVSQCQNKTVQVNGQSLEVSQFVPFNKRERLQNNIYIKNLPGKNEQFDEQKVESLLKQEAQKYGNVTSMMVKFDERHQKHFAFVCYSDSNDAKKAYNQIEQFQIDNQKVEVNWAQTKQERNMQNMKKSINKTNVFMKNLLDTVNEEQLRKAFEKFGVVKSAAVRMPMKVPAHVTQKTQMGFVNFQTESMAQEAINSLKSQSENQNDICRLFLNNNPELCIHKTKQQMSSSSRQNNMNLMQMIHSCMNNPQMFMQAMNQVMMMNMNMMMKGPNRNRNMNMMGRPQNMMQGMTMPMMAGRYPMMPANNNMNMPMSGMNMPNMAMNNMAMANMPSMGMANVNKLSQNQQVEQKLTPASLKENLKEFIQYDQEKQRSILGELLFPAVSKLTENAEQVPKITGMLIDFDVFEVAEILEFLENDELLKERIEEAEELIQNTGASN